MFCYVFVGRCYRLFILYVTIHLFRFVALFDVTVRLLCCVTVCCWRLRCGIPRCVVRFGICLTWWSTLLHVVVALLLWWHTYLLVRWCVVVVYVAILLHVTLRYVALRCYAAIPFTADVVYSLCRLLRCYWPCARRYVCDVFVAFLNALHVAFVNTVILTFVVVVVYVVTVCSIAGVPTFVIIWCAVDYDSFTVVRCCCTPRLLPLWIASFPLFVTLLCACIAPFVVVLAFTCVWLPFVICCSTFLVTDCCYCRFAFVVAIVTFLHCCLWRRLLSVTAITRVVPTLLIYVAISLFVTLFVTLLYVVVAWLVTLTGVVVYVVHLYVLTMFTRCCFICCYHRCSLLFVWRCSGCCCSFTLRCCLLLLCPVDYSLLLLGLLPRYLFTRCTHLRCDVIGCVIFALRLRCWWWCRIVVCCCCCRCCGGKFVVVTLPTTQFCRAPVRLFVVCYVYRIRLLFVAVTCSLHFRSLFLFVVVRCCSYLC